jgi:hypothetical protein
MHASSGPVENVALLTCVLREKESRVRRWRPHTALLPRDSLSRRLGSCHVEGGADRRALPLDACTGRAGATAASVRDEQRTAVCRGAPRALAAGVSAGTERLAERDACANVDAAAVAGMPEIGGRLSRKREHLCAEHNLPPS